MRYISLALLLLLAACAVPGTSGGAVPASGADARATATTVEPKRVDSPAPTASATAAVSPTPESSPRPHYELNLTLDYAAHVAYVSEQIRYTNRSGTALDELVLAVEPALWPGAFSLNSLDVDGQPSKADFDGQRMTVKPAQPLAVGQSILLEMEYILQIPPENQRYLFGYNDHQTNLLDWYPFIVPYKSGGVVPPARSAAGTTPAAQNGWVLHDPGPAGEHLVYESADFDVNLRFAHTLSPPTVAASAPGVEAGEDTTSYHLEGARGFSLSVSERFLTSAAQAGGVLVTSYYFDGHQAAGAQAAAAAAQAVQLFSEKFAPYPYQTLSVVESASADGMEADGLFFMAGSFYNTYDGTLQNYLTTLSVHETSHQWWYGLVGNDQALEPWLDEALATYSERIFYQETHPDLVNWWWDFRIRRFNPAGKLNSDIYVNGPFRPYTNAVYFMGAYWLEDLRVRIGDEAFYATLSDYAKENARQIATAEAFFAALKRHTGTDYSDLVDEYFK